MVVPGFPGRRGRKVEAGLPGKSAVLSIISVVCELGATSGVNGLFMICVCNGGKDRCSL